MILPKRPSKLENVCEKARHCIKCGDYRYTIHGHERKLERQITELDALYVIKNGYHVPKRDVFCEINKGWTYAFEGETLQDELIRVIVAFVETVLVIVTVIPIQKRS